jgi:hypothetical protein
LKKLQNKYSGNHGDEYNKNNSYIDKKKNKSEYGLSLNYCENVFLGNIKFSNGKKVIF